MHTSYENKNQDRRIYWSFLGDYTLSVEISNKDYPRKAMLASELSEAIRGLGTPPECLLKIENTLMEFIEQIRRPPDQGGMEFSMVIRLFWQEKAEQILGYKPVMDLSSMDTQGAWGYFLIDKTGDRFGKESERSHCFIDLYLYKDRE